MEFLWKTFKYLLIDWTSDRSSWIYLENFKETPDRISKIILRNSIQKRKLVDLVINFSSWTCWPKFPNFLIIFSCCTLTMAHRFLRIVRKSFRIFLAIIIDCCSWNFSSMTSWPEVNFLRPLCGYHTKKYRIYLGFLSGALCQVILDLKNKIQGLYTKKKKPLFFNNLFWMLLRNREFLRIYFQGLHVKK